MPFGEYKDFDDCVSKNKDKDDPEAYCATIKRNIEGEVFDPKELEMGKKVEMEHTDNPDEAEKIAKDHLKEVPDYYTKLKKYVEPSKSNELALYCQYCGKFFDDPEQIKPHIEAQHGGKQSKLFESDCGCKYRGFIAQQMESLKSKAREGQSYNLFLDQPVVSGKKIKGTLAYAGVSLNNRLYLPEELAKGNKMKLPLILNHASTAGAENELNRLPPKFRQGLENGLEMKVGEVVLDWNPEKLTLYYEGYVEDDFFKDEITEANMAVSLGMYYDSDSPKICDESCYTVIKGSEFHEVSLVYHPGFPIATIEANEVRMKFKAFEDNDNRNADGTFASKGTGDQTGGGGSDDSGSTKSSPEPKKTSIPKKKDGVKDEEDKEKPLKDIVDTKDSALKKEYKAGNTSVKSLHPSIKDEAIQKIYDDFAGDKLRKNEWEDFTKSEHGKVGSGYHKEDEKTTIGKMMQMLNFFDRNPSKSFNPYDDLPDHYYSAGIVMIQN